MPSSWFSDTGFPRLCRFSPATPEQSKPDSARSQDSSSSSTRFVTAQRLAALIMHILYPEKRIRPLTLLRAQLYRERSFILRRFTSLTKFHTKFVLVKRARQTHTHTNVCHPTNCPSVFDERFLSPSPSRDRVRLTHGEKPPSRAVAQFFGLISIFFFSLLHASSVTRWRPWPDNEATYLFKYRASCPFTRRFMHAAELIAGPLSG